MQSHWFPFYKNDCKSKCQLFCLPYAGGGALVYRHWIKAFVRNISAVPIQLPGRENRIKELVPHDIPELVDQIGRMLIGHLDRRFAIFGHSLGAIVGFELARWLRREYGILPVHIFVSGRAAPQLPRCESPTYGLPDEEFLSEVEKFNGTPNVVLSNTEMMKVLLPILRSDFRLAETYEYSNEPPLACPLTAYGGMNDRTVSLEDLNSWKAQTCSEFAAELFEGDHFFLKSKENELISRIHSTLSENPP